MYRMNAAQLLAATLTAGVRSWRAGQLSIDEARALLTASTARLLGAGHEHVVVDGGASTARPLAQVLPTFAPLTPDEVVLALPVPGDPAGLPGPAVFQAAALAAGHGVVAGQLGLVVEPAPGRMVTWRAWPHADAPRLAHLTVADAEFDLVRELEHGTEQLAQWGGAQLTPEIHDALLELRSGSRDLALPAGYDARTRRVAARAISVGRLVDLADTAPAGAAAASDIATRSQLLRRLGDAARIALMAAVNAPLR